MKRLYVLLFLITVFKYTLFAQQIPAAGPVIQSREYPQNYFRSPLNIPHQASGTFGELRATHFHAGDDYRTQQRVGLPLFAVADGYVSRLRVQSGGGGNSVYIAHPNGFTSVYLHMEDFEPTLAHMIRQRQYRDKEFAVDIDVVPGLLSLKKGDRIGTAGNTGSSQGPHLHFEIRDTETQNPINPQLFGLHFPDKTPPLIHGLMLYDLGGDPFSEQTPRRPLKVKSTGSGHYVLEDQTPLQINGRVGISINTIDRHNGTSFSHGVYSIELFLDDKPISTVVFESLNFASSGAIHSFVDYPHYRRTNTRYQKSFKDPNNPINIFTLLEKDGSIELKEGQEATLTYRVRDVHGNTATVAIPVRQDNNYNPGRKVNPGTVMFRHNKTNQFETENIEVHLPENTLYDHVYFRYHQGAQPEGGYSLMQHVHNDLTPLFRSYELKIRPDESLPAHLLAKALIVDDRKRSHGGKYENGMVVTHSRSFGNFYVGVDTIPPRIEAVNIAEGRNMANMATARFRISDNLSGIHSFNAYLNGKWVLMEYDPKTRSLWHRFESGLRRGKQHLRLEVTDGKQNMAVFEANFTR